MPELPEMEVYRRHLETRCRGRTVINVEVGRVRSLNVPVGVFKKALRGSTLAGFDRKGKHLVCQLSTGAYLLNHLMLGGGIYHGTESDRPERTFQVIIRLDDGTSLYWFGLRLGWLHLLSAAELAERTADLGLDPFDPAFTPGHLAEILHGRRGQLKPLLVDQRFFPGVGNCYSDELCWAARIHPQQVAGRLNAQEQGALWEAMRSTLSDAVNLGGYTETPFHAGDRFTGSYLPHLKVYDRKGEPCPRCGAVIAFLEASGRKVFFCPTCQQRSEPVETVDVGGHRIRANHGDRVRPG